MVIGYWVKYVCNPLWAPLLSFFRTWVPWMGYAPLTPHRGEFGPFAPPSGGLGGLRTRPNLATTSPDTSRLAGPIRHKHRQNQERADHPGLGIARNIDQRHAIAQIQNKQDS